MRESENSADEIFQQAIRIVDDSAREQFVADSCHDNDSLRKDVEQRIQSHLSGIRGLDETTDGQSGNAVASGVPTVGSHIGPYRLVEEIGEGGMGIVFLAQQTAPINRRVALKVIKVGMDTRRVVARFETERQTMALMDHPGITKVLDAGATDSGRPYFVMELVQGQPITKYCDVHRLSLRQRLSIFAQVCGAIRTCAPERDNSSRYQTDEHSRHRTGRDAAAQDH